MRADKPFELTHQYEVPEPSLNFDVCMAKMDECNASLAQVLGKIGSLAFRIDRMKEPNGEGTLNVIISSFAALGYALSARALLLLALLGAFALAVLAMENQTTMGLLILAAYSLSTVVPVTVLEIRKTRE